MSDDVLKAGADQAMRYLQALPSRAVRPDPDAVARLDEFAAPIPETATDPLAALRTLEELGAPATMAMGGPRFFGFVIGGAMPVTLAANWIASAWDQNSAYFLSTPSSAAIEETALAWTLDGSGCRRIRRAASSRARRSPTSRRSRSTAPPVAVGRLGRGG